MALPSKIQPALLRKMTVRQVLESLHKSGPLSRAELTRDTGISAPTISKAVGHLVDFGIIEEGPAPVHTLGRPGRRLRLASESSLVIGVAIDVDRTEVVAASLNGVIDTATQYEFATPGTYDALLEEVIGAIQRIRKADERRLLGIGVSAPGLVDEEQKRCLLSPNLPITNQRSPADDITNAMSVPTACIQESKALCLAERLYGQATEIDNFAMIDVSQGLGLGVYNGGEVLRGMSGLAGELGHITVDPTGILCGCGNHGCLETMATDMALIREVSDRVGRTMSFAEIQAGVRDGSLQISAELNRICEYVAIAIAAAINLFNPRAVFVLGRLLSLHDGTFDKVIEMTRRRTMLPAFKQSEIFIAAGSKRQGAIAAIVSHLMDSLGPKLSV